MPHESSPAADEADWFLAFAEWRIERYSVNPRKSVKYFKQSHSHALIWALVMRGHYTNTPPTFKDCIRHAACATETTRKIIFNAVHEGYFAIDSAVGDSRKKLIKPSGQCVAEYESHVGTFLNFAEVLRPATDGRAQG